MTLNQKLASFFKRKYSFSTLKDLKSLRIQKPTPFIIVSFLVIFSIVFFISSNFIDKKNHKNSDNLDEITKNSEFSNLTNFFISKINSPYQEINYEIKNNDTVEKILKNFKVKDKDIKNISSQLKKKKLTYIYSGRKLSLIIATFSLLSVNILAFLTI